MKSVKLRTMGIMVGCAALTATGAAVAQEATAKVGAGATATTTTTTTVAPAPAPASSPPAPAQTGMALPGANPDPAAGTTDHAAMVGHFGIGYLGRRTIGITTDAGGANLGTVDAPVIGMRYWLDPMLGIDAGLGVLLSTGATKADPAGASVDRQGFTVFILHGGVPLALAGSRHFTFEIIPEMNLGFASSGQRGAGAGGSDVDFSGFHLDLGARAGAEVQFGFIGIPELSLQAGVGLALSYDRIKRTEKTTPETATTVTQTALGTSVGDNPWNIFTGNVAAIYYFD